MSYLATTNCWSDSFRNAGRIASGMLVGFKSESWSVSRRNRGRIHPEYAQKIDDENRRLFYVALTRAKESLFIITENGKISPYLADISEYVEIPEIDWDKYPPVTGETNVLVVRISGQFHFLTDEFKADGFQFRRQKNKPFRDKKYLREDFSIQKLKNTSWSQKALSIPDKRFEVSVLDGMNAVVESYSVVAGQWTKSMKSLVPLYDKAALLFKTAPAFDKKTIANLPLTSIGYDIPFE